MLRPGATLNATFARADARLARGPVVRREPLTMTGADVEAALIHLGMKPSAAAACLGMNPSLLSRYRLGARVTRRVQAGIRALLEQRRAEDERIRAALDTLDPGDEIACPWYWTVQDWVGERIVSGHAGFYHYQAAVAVAAHRDSRLILVPFDPLAYTIWRGDRADSDRLRELWASVQ